VSGSGSSWAICKSAPRSREITTPALSAQFFTGWMPFLPPNQQRQSTEGIRALEAKTVNNNKWGVTVKMAAACNCSLA